MKTTYIEEIKFCPLPPLLVSNDGIQPWSMEQHLVGAALATGDLDVAVHLSHLSCSFVPNPQSCGYWASEQGAGTERSGG